LITTEQQQRDLVWAEARTWLRTPYHPVARKKGAGVDCAQLPAAVYAGAGLVEEIPLDPYSPQWHVNQHDELYLQEVLKHAVEIPGPPGIGDFVLYRVGHCWAHGAIVGVWPQIVHAVSGQCVMLGDGQRDPLAKVPLGRRSPRFFTLWPQEAS
jgi:cell wall-associated NlpC family hydrolase